jgi:hypothetical protein
MALEFSFLFLMGPNIAAIVFFYARDEILSTAPNRLEMKILCAGVPFL